MTEALQIAWEWLDRPGLELLRIAESDAMVELNGNAVFEFEQGTAQLRYTVRLDAGWHVQHARVHCRQGGKAFSTELSHSGTGWWVDGELRPDLADCDDIDIMGSPSTNTLPIRRLPWIEGVPRGLHMAYIRLPDLKIEPVAQRYTAIDPSVGGARRFRYESVATGFSAELHVDQSGLVVDYPPYWRRLR